MLVDCAQCGEPVSRLPSELRKSKSGRAFCDRACQSLWQKGENHPTYKGRVNAARGYVRIYVPGHPMAARDGYVQEHRLVMAEKLGRYLRNSEHVHHINGIKDDNRPENLELMDPSAHHRRHVEAAGVVTNQFGTFPLVRNQDPDERRERKREYMRRWREENRDHVREYARRYEAARRAR